MLLALIEDLDDQFSIAIHLTRTYGGNLVKNALRVPELTFSENKLTGVKDRVGNNDIVRGADQPRAAQMAYDDTAAGPGRVKAYSFDDGPAPVTHSTVAPVGSVSRVPLAATRPLDTMLSASRAPQAPGPAVSSVVVD